MTPLAWDEQRRQAAAGRPWASMGPAAERAPHAYQRTTPVAAATPRQEPSDATVAPAPARPPRPARDPSGRYLLLSTDGHVVYGPGLDVQVGDAIGAVELVSLVRAAWPEGREAIVYLHEEGCQWWGLGQRRPRTDLPPFLAGAVEKGAAWWVVARPGAADTHLYVTTWGGTWRGCPDAPHLLAEAEAFRDALGLAWAFSGPSTLFHLIRATGHVTVPDEHPAIEGTADSAWRVPAHAWASVLPSHRELPLARAFDRGGSYLAAWRGTRLADGAWEHTGPGVYAGKEPDKPAGYWRVDPGWLAAGREWGLPDPFARCDDGPVWLTTPLMQLAYDVGGPAHYTEAWLATRTRKPLEVAGERVVAARAALADRGPARQALKEAYAGAVAWLEWGPPPPHPLHRPDWRRTIVDRHVANTWRALDRCPVPPMALGGIDAAIFAVADERPPPGLRVGGGVGAWKPKGPPVPIAPVIGFLERAEVAEALKACGA